MNIIKKLHALKEIKFIGKFDKYVVSLEPEGEKKIEGLWLSIKQGENLKSSFKNEPYSNKNNQVYAVFEKKEDGKLRFIWSCSNYHNAVNMAERFNAVFEEEADCA